MKKLYTISFVAYGGITIEAEDEDDAFSRFYIEQYTTLRDDIAYELAANGAEITDIVEEGE